MIDNQKGYTLMELLVVIAIFGIISSFLIINSSGLIESYRLRLNANQVFSIAHKSRSFAVSNSNNYTLEISSSELAIYQEGKIEAIEVFDLYPGISASHSRSDDKTIFYPLGTASPGTITISNTRGSSYSVVVASVGRIRIEKN